jgi:hypothetical protein
MGRSLRMHLTVFTFGVLMLLLRPYCIYQMTAQDIRTEPARAWSLLQRLVKKKDEHHAEQAFDLFALFHVNTKIRPERKLIASLLAFLAVRFGSLPAPELPVLSLVPVSRRYRFRSLSCLLI